MVLPIKFYVIAASLGTIVYLSILLRSEIAAASRTICALPPTRKFALAVMLLIAVAFGGTKTNQVDQTSGTNDVSALPPAGIAFRTIRNAPPSSSPSVMPEDIAFGWQCMGPRTIADFSYTMPENAVFATNWWLRGAYEDVAKIGLESLGGLGGLERYDSMWAFTWGKVRFALTDTNEIVAVGAPMSAVPFRSRLWSTTDSNEAFRITWEDFILGRSNALVSAQIEFRANGDYVVRSNNVETVWRRIDPDDIDGDGYLNDDDACPYDWDEGADEFYGPCNDLPDGCNEDAYCNVTVEVDDQRSQWVTFTGDGYSNYSDPQFYAKPGIPYDVKILIGKTYRVTCDAPIRAVGTSDDEIDVSDVSSNAFTVVWPVTITEAPRLFAAPPRGLLGGSRGNTGFTMDVYPSWLDGVFEWGTNACCQIVDNGDWWSFSCEDGCTCNGCLIGGGYTYEGYTLGFSGVRCGCDYRANLVTRWGIAAPDLLFKDGAPRPLNISFYHGDPDYPEEGTLTLQVNDGGRIQIWEDEKKTSAASTFSWDVSSFNGHAFYLEGIGASDSVGDITFDLTWTRPGGSSVTYTATTTCAEVKETQVTSSLPDGSPNPPPFEGNTHWDFDVTHSPNPDKHFAVLFRDAVNDDFSVRDFSVDMTLVVQPAGAPVGTATWFPLEPTPQSGSIVSTGSLVGTLLNPKVGGVYHIGSCFDGSPTNECNIVLPLAGAEMINILHGDIARADRFLNTAKEKYTYDERTSFKFGWRWFFSHENGDYTGRPENGQTPSVWYYGQVEPYSGMGNICTLAGTPTKLAKLSNLLTAYCCEKLQVSPFKQALSQLLGHLNGNSATISWECGQDIANGTNFYFAVSNMARQAWREMDDRVTKPWPNVLPAVNWHEKTTYLGINRNVYSPAFLNHTP